MRRDSREKQGDEEGTGLKHPVTDEQRSFSIEDQADSPRLCDLFGLTRILLLLFLRKQNQRKSSGKRIRARTDQNLTAAPRETT